MATSPSLDAMEGKCEAADEELLVLLISVDYCFVYVLMLEPRSRIGYHSTVQNGSETQSVHLKALHLHVSLSAPSD